MGATTTVTGDNLEQLISDNEILLIDFYADWCGPCRTFGPIFEAAAEKHDAIGFAKCDTEAAPDVAGAFGVRSIPTLAVFREGVLVFLQAGALPAPMLEELIEKVGALDMDDVRAKIAEQEQQQATPSS